MADTHLFTVEGATFALGLFWQPLSGTTPADRAKEVRSLAQELSFNMAVTRNSTMHCVGFAKATQALKVGVYSAAAVVSKSLDVELKARDFIFVSALPDGQWAYVAQRDGVILPDGDQAFVSEDAARARLLEHMSLGDWPLIIAPSIWGIGGAIERDFLELIPRKKSGKIKVHKWWSLMPVDRRRAAVTAHAGKIALVALVVGGVIGGGLFYKKWKAERDARLAAEAAAAAAVAMQVDASGQVIRPENPWKSKPLAGDMVHACLDALSTQRVFPGNWDLSAIECTDGQLKLTWKPRAGGWIKHLKEIEPAAIIAVDGSTASVNIPLRSLKTGHDEAAPEQNKRLIYMYSTAQAYGVSFGVTPAKPVSAPVLPGQEAAPPQVFWQEINWLVDGARLPDVVLAALDGPGFRMNAMKGQWINGSFVWTMEGTQYVQP